MVDNRHELPNIRLTMPFAVSRDTLQQYLTAVTFGKGFDRDQAERTLQNIFHDPMQLCLMLSALTEPVMLLLLAHASCPIRPLGAVNVANRFEIKRVHLCSRSNLENSGSASSTTYTVNARLDPQTRPVRRGHEIDIIVDLLYWRPGDEHEGAVVFTQIFTMLQFGANTQTATATATATSEPRSAPTKDPEKGESEKTMSIVVKLALDGPLAWARICKDYNPIHISTMFARLFGYKNRIAHGNHALAAGLAQLGAPLDLGRRSEIVQRKWAVEVRFRRPIVLPANYETRIIQHSDAAWSIEIRMREKICVVGSINQIQSVADYSRH